MTGGGINTVRIDGEYIHITDLDHKILCSEWAKLRSELTNLKNINAKASEGWRGVVLRIIGVRLPVDALVLEHGTEAKPATR